MPDSTRPTLKDIALAAGVSPMAVSLALRNSPRIGAATRERLQGLAREMGYRPNAFATTLVQHRISRHAQFQAALAFVHCGVQREDWRRSGTYTSFRRGALERAEALGYALEELWLEDPQLTPDKFQSLLHHRGIPGLLLSSLADDMLTRPSYMAKFHELDISRLACATIGWRMEQPAISCASNDQYQTTSLAMKRMITLGYERIGLVISETNDQALDRRFRAGYLAYQDTLPSDHRLPVISPGRAGRAKFLRWQQEWRPDALLTLMPHVLPWLRHGRVDVPGEVAVALLDLQGDRHDRGYAGINQNHAQVGMAAVDLIVAQIQRNEAGIPPYQKSLLIRGEWVDGWTAPGRATSG